MSEVPLYAPGPHINGTRWARVGIERRARDAHATGRGARERQLMRRARAQARLGRTGSEARLETGTPRGSRGRGWGNRSFMSLIRIQRLDVNTV